MIGNGLCDRLPWVDLPVPDQLGYQLRVMDDSKVSIKLRIFVLDGVETMRALRHDALE